MRSGEYLPCVGGSCGEPIYVLGGPDEPRGPADYFYMVSYMF